MQTKHICHLIQLILDSKSNKSVKRFKIIFKWSRESIFQNKSLTVWWEKWRKYVELSAKWVLEWKRQHKYEIRAQIRELNGIKKWVKPNERNKKALKTWLNYN